MTYHDSLMKTIKRKLIENNVLRKKKCHCSCFIDLIIYDVVIFIMCNKLI
jgi:hypothetical protein